MPDPTPVDRAAVERLLRAGLSAQVVAERLQCSERTVQRIRRDELGLPCARDRHRFTAEEIARVDELLAEGASLREAMRSIGRPPRTWSRRWRGRGWTNEEVIDWARAHRIARRKGIVL